MEMSADIHLIIEEGENVVAIYDFLGPGGKMPFAEWFVVSAGKIQSSKLHYDPRPFLE